MTWIVIGSLLLIAGIYAYYSSKRNLSAQEEAHNGGHNNHNREHTHNHSGGHSCCH